MAQSLTGLSATHGSVFTVKYHVLGEQHIGVEEKRVTRGAVLKQKFSSSADVASDFDRKV